MAGSPDSKVKVPDVPETIMHGWPILMAAQTPFPFVLKRPCFFSAAEPLPFQDTAMPYDPTMMKVISPASSHHIKRSYLKITSGKRKRMYGTINKLGFWAGLAAAAATTAYCLVQLLQLYGKVSYPTDERLIYGTSLFIVIPFILAMLAFHYITPEAKKFWSHAALVFTILYAVFVTANYVVQLATVIPMTLKGSLNEVRLLQQTPHSLFWDFDALGYIFMGLACGIALPAFEKKGFQKWVRLAFMAHALVTPLISIVYFYPVYSYKLLILGFPWAVTAPLFMLMLALLFRKNYRALNPIRRSDVKPADRKFFVVKKPIA